MLIKLFGGRVTIGKDLSQYGGTSDDFYAITQGKYGTDYSKHRQLKAYKNVVYACVSLIGDACGAYEPLVQRKKGDQWETIEHPLLDLIRRPTGDPRNPNTPKTQNFSQFDLFEATGVLESLQGKTYWYLAKGQTSGKPRRIIPLRADRVGMDIDKKTGEINGYFIRQNYGDPIPLDVDEVLEFKLFNPDNGYDGKSQVEAGSDYIQTDEYTSKFTKNFFLNNAGISGVLNIKGEVTKNAFKKFTRAWREKYQGVGNAGKVAIIRDSDADFTKVGLGLDEINMDALRKMSLAEVAMIFRVPLELTGKITDGAGLGRGNIETLEYIFAKWNIDKKFKRFDDVLQFALNRYWPETQDGTYRIVHENIIPEDKEYMLNARDKAVDRWKTRDEIRDEDGLDSVDGGDQLFVPAMQIPINEASTNAATGGTASAGLRVKITRTIKKKGLSKQAIERFRSTLMRNQARYERQYKKVLKPIFKQQRAEALVNLEAHGASLKKSQDQKLFDDAAYDALMVQELSPMLQDLAKTQGGLALVFAGDDENEFHLTSNVLAKITKSTQKMASNFNDDTLAKLNTTLAEGVQAGEGIGELKARVNDVYDELDGYRAERLARTETLKASNSATLEAYRQTGYVTGMKWADNPGACEICVELAAEDAISLDETFRELGSSVDYEDENGDPQSYAIDYEPIDTPPVHPNCRCTIIPISE